MYQNYFELVSISKSRSLNVQGVSRFYCFIIIIIIIIIISGINDDGGDSERRWWRNIVNVGF